MPARPPYFAYGSNMDPVQMKERCPGALFRATALLTNHRLGFSRKSQNRGCGAADVLPVPGQTVWGVVYDIGDEVDWAALDKAEGYRPGRKMGNSYHLDQVRVHPGGDLGISLTVLLYIAEKQENPPLPSEDYLGHLLRGADHWGLPADYRGLLGRVPTQTVGLT